jgi:hypothetical protein
MTANTDRDRLRRLASQYAEITTGAAMQARRELWRRTNRLLERTVPFQIEDNGSFFADLTPPLECVGVLERELERQLLQVVTCFQLIDDDRIAPPYACVDWRISRPGICPDLVIKRTPDATGRSLGYETNKPLANLEADFHKLKRGPFSVDRDGTLQRFEMARAAIGDILPVRIVNSHHATGAGAGLAGKAVSLMSMELLYMAMVDQPEGVHRLFDFLAQEACDFQNWLEAENLITPNHTEYWVGSGSCGFTDELPRRALRDGEPVRFEDCWGFQEAQESVGISPAMYEQFIHPYQRRTSDRYGLLYYGCCEPVHRAWPVIKQFKNLRKITVSPWCDQAVIAEAAGRSCVLSRKPHPMKLCAEWFDPKEFEAHIRETLDITKNNFVELIFRDTCTLNGSMKERVASACRIVHRLLGR